MTGTYLSMKEKTIKKIITGGRLALIHHDEDRPKTLKYGYISYFN